MNPLSPTGQGDQNLEFSAAMAFAANESQLEHWNRPEPRLKASVVVPYEDGEAARLEIKRRAGDRRFAHVLDSRAAPASFSASAAIGRSSKRRWRRGCRSASTSSATAAGR